MTSDLTDFGRTHFSDADAGDKRRTDRLVRAPDRRVVVVLDRRRPPRG